MGCVLVDLDVPGNLDALPVLLARTSADAVAVVVLATRPDPADVIAAMKKGVSDFLLLPVAQQVLCDAIDTAIARTRRQSDRASRLASLKKRYASLTYEEQWVARSVCQGHRNRDIAEELGIAERTVKNHRASALKKLAVDSVPALVHAFILLDADDPHGNGWAETEAPVR
ncbi:LuxR C-terminal-related transcriptional regulator [Variovorax sp. J22R24]|uniref:response regulator transcription factor n=1 Tax=Variovorax gracilis TaxID=3053502 RepID=UPI0025782162|nr:LuxR C-terminal-related transcriptional regulator [Variovorax sp. J22R24]MDM0108865.1 LuxR C-terminal-related transcriptional regulator [Variovorax sp. J22R24]